MIHVFLYRFCLYGGYQILENHLLDGVFISSIQKIKVRVKVTAAQCDVKTLLFFALHIHQTLKLLTLCDWINAKRINSSALTAQACQFLVWDEEMRLKLSSARWKMKKFPLMRIFYYDRDRSLGNRKICLVPSMSNFSLISPKKAYRRWRHWNAKKKTSEKLFG